MSGLLWVARDRKTEEVHMAMARNKGFRFDFAFEPAPAQRGLADVEYSGLYIGNLFFADSSEAAAISLITQARRKGLPILVRPYTTRDEEICSERGIPIVKRLQLKVRGAIYLIERFEDTFGARSSGLQ